MERASGSEHWTLSWGQGDVDKAGACWWGDNCLQMCRETQIIHSAQDPLYWQTAGLVPLSPGLQVEMIEDLREGLCSGTQLPCLWSSSLGVLIRPVFVFTLKQRVFTFCQLRSQAKTTNDPNTSVQVKRSGSLGSVAWPTQPRISTSLQDSHCLLLTPLSAHL